MLTHRQQDSFIRMLPFCQNQESRIEIFGINAVNFNSGDAILILSWVTNFTNKSEVLKATLTNRHIPRNLEGSVPRSISVL
jgi:hypothetical protein